MNGAARFVAGITLSSSLTYGVFFANEASHEYRLCQNPAVQAANKAYCEQSVLESTNKEIEGFPWPFASIALLGGIAIGLESYYRSKS